MSAALHRYKIAVRLSFPEGIRNTFFFRFFIIFFRFSHPFSPLFLNLAIALPYIFYRINK